MPKEGQKAITVSGKVLRASIKSGSSYFREKKLAELGAVIRGVSYPSVSYVGVKKANVTKTKGTSNAERQFKLKELGRMIRGL